MDAGRYNYGGFRYTNLQYAVAEAQRGAAPPGGAKATRS
jgi:hypothetical protein